MSGDLQLTAHEGDLLLAGPKGQAAIALTVECPLRFSWVVHLWGGCRHYAPPGGGRVGSVQCECQGEPPEGWVRTQAQERLDALLASGKE